MNFNKQKCITAVILLLVAILSITVIGKYASAPENHQKTIASLDEKKQTVMELTAASTVTSALITLLPGDTATPIADDTSYRSRPSGQFPDHGQNIFTHAQHCGHGCEHHEQEK